MSIKTDIFSGTLNQPITINPPPHQQTTVNFVLYNQSPFVLTVNVGQGAIVTYCPAFTADIYKVEPQNPIVVTPLSSIGAESPLANQIFGVFYDQAEELPFTVFPASLFGSPESVLVDNPQIIDSRTIAAAEITFVSSVFDVRRFQSFQIVCWSNAANAGPPANTARLELVWLDPNFPSINMHSQIFEINSENSVDCGRTRITDRMFGPSMFYIVSLGNGPAADFDMHLSGSNRSVDRLRVQERGVTEARGLGVDNALVLFTGSIAAGATVRRNVRLGSGLATLFYNFRLAGGPVNIFFRSPHLLSLDANHLWFLANNVPIGTDATRQLHLPQRASDLSLTNTGAAAVTANVSLIADSD